MKILACTDGSEQSYKALEEAAKIADSVSGEVSVIYVEEPIPHPNEWGYYFSEDSLKQYEERREKDRKEMMETATRIFSAKNLNFKTIIKKGHPAETITQVASEEEFDVIMMGNRGLGGLKEKFLGSISNAVVQKAETSVIIVK